MGKTSIAHAAALVMINGIFRCQDTTLALHLVTDITVCLVHTDHDAWHFGP